MSKPTNQLAKEKDNSFPNLWQNRLNIFLIGYFNYLVLALAVIITLAGLAFFIYPQYKKISQADQATRSNLETESAIKSDYLLKIKNLKDSYREVSEADRAKIKEMVPVDSNIIGLIPEIESMVLRNGAVLETIKVVPEESQGPARVKTELGEKLGLPSSGFSGELPQGVKLVKIEISISSVNYPILKNLLKTFENNLRLLDVTKVNYDVSGNKLVLIIYTYYLI